MAALVSSSIYLFFFSLLHYYSFFLNPFFGTHIPLQKTSQAALEACRSKVAPHDITVSLHSAHLPSSLVPPLLATQLDPLTSRRGCSRGQMITTKIASQLSLSLYIDSTEKYHDA
jgi:hypothetical protein